MRPPRPCRDCGKSFVPAHGNTVRCDLCHDSMLATAQREMKERSEEKALRPRVCGRCGKTFEVDRPTRKSTCPPCEAERKKDLASRPSQRKSRKVWARRHPEKRAAQKQRWKERHREKIRAYKREYDRTTRRQYRVKLITNVRSRIATALRAAKVKGQNVTERGAMRFVGCTLAEFADYLESQFSEGMSWANFGYRGWHVDHIFPVGLADLADPAHVRAAFNYRNCQPMWAAENHKKKDKVTPAARALFDELVDHFRRLGSSADSGPPAGREQGDN